MPPTDPHADELRSRSEPFAPADAFLPDGDHDPYADPAPRDPAPAGDFAAGPAPLPGPFVPTEGVPANRAAWAAAAGAAACLGVWQFGLWEVELSDPPAGELAENGGPAEPGAPATDPAALDWGSEWDPDAGLTGDPAADDPAGGGDAFDLLADAAPPADPAAVDADLWGEEPAEVAVPTADPLDAVAFDPPPIPDSPPAGPAAAAENPAGFWGEEPPAVAAAPETDPFAAGALGEPADPFAPAASPVDATPVAAAASIAEVDEDPFGPAVPASAVAADAVRVASASSADDAAAVVPADRDDPFYTDDEPAGAAPAGPNSAADFFADSPARSATDDLIAAVDAAVEAGEVLEAHTALSRLWWDAPADRPRVRGRLDGTARRIYFDAASHFMTPRTVAAGESLADVAADLSVPVMYLARVNAVAPAAVTAGTDLKVIRGPFGAACDLAGGTLTVHAHGYYVRAFHCDAAGVRPGAYSVGAKAKTPAGVSLLLNPAAGGDPVKLSAAETTDAAPGLGLSSLDAAQVFDLLKVGDSLVVRP